MFFKKAMSKKIIQFSEAEVAANFDIAPKGAYQGVKNVRFSENFACFIFLNTRFEIHPFALLPTKYSCSKTHWARLWLEHTK